MISQINGGLTEFFTLAETIEFSEKPIETWRSVVIAWETGVEKEEKMKKVILISIFAIMIGGCATPYKRVGFTGGYSETQLGENIFQVSFRGNAYTSRERASDFSLLRCAEVGLEHGYRYFVIVDSEKYSKTGTYTTPTTSYTTATVYGSGNYAYGSGKTTTYGGQTYFITKPRATNTILCFKEKPDINGLVYDAQFISNSIRAKYNIKN